MNGGEGGEEELSAREGWRKRKRRCGEGGTGGRGTVFGMPS